MPILGTSVYGAGTLYTIGAADPHAYLTYGTVYYQTAQFNAAIRMTAPDADFIIAGSVASDYIGVSIEGAGVASISVTSIGYLAGDNRAINIYSDQDFILHNAGIIESAGSTTGGSAIYTAGAHFSDTIIVNSGIIRSTGTIFDDSILLGDGDDRIINTGTITGNIRLGGGSDYIDTRAGIFVDTVYGGEGNDTYWINADTSIFEYGDEGVDTVNASFDYEMDQNLENLNLKGTAQYGAGNALINYINGNNTANELYGFDGNDTLNAAPATTVFTAKTAATAWTEATAATSRAARTVTIICRSIAGRTPCWAAPAMIN